MKDKPTRLSRRDFASLAIGFGLIAASHGLPLEKDKVSYSTEVTPQVATEILSYNPLIIVHRSANQITSIGRTAQLDYPVGLDGDLRQVNEDNLVLLHGHSFGPFVLRTDPKEFRMGHPGYLEDMFPLFPQNSTVALQVKERLKPQTKVRLNRIIRNNNPSRTIIHSSLWEELDSLRRASGDNENFSYHLGSVADIEAFLDPHQQRKSVWGRPEYVLAMQQPAEHYGISMIADVYNPEEALAVCRAGAKGFIADFKVIQAITQKAASVNA